MTALIKKTSCIVLLFIVSIGSLVFGAAYGRAELSVQWTIDGVPTDAVSSGDVHELKIKLSDSVTHEIISRYQAVQSHKMHLIIVKDDLSSFVHIHPTLIGVTGTFSVILNQPSFEPDNVQAEDAILAPGKYYLFIEVFPMRTSLSPIGEFARFSLRAIEPQSPADPYKKLQQELAALSAPPSDLKASYRMDPPIPIIPPKIVSRQTGKIDHYFKLSETTTSDGPHYSIANGGFGDTYRVSASVDTIGGCGGRMVRWHYQLSEWDSNLGQYVIVSKLEDWLGMQGHALLVSTNGDSLDSKEFYHIHGMQHGPAGPVMFLWFDREMQKSFNANGRLFKIWSQFKHKGRILTFPMLMDLNGPYEIACLP